MNGSPRIYDHACASRAAPARLAEPPPPDHWQFWLAERLRSRGEPVLYPQMPDPDEPRYERWAEVLHGELSMLGDAERVVVCHSLSCLLWSHFASRELRQEERVDRVLFVAPPAPSAFVPAVASFRPERLDAGALAYSARRPIRLACSDNDPYCPEGAMGFYGEALGLDTDLLPGTGHLDVEAGFGPWPAVAAWIDEPDRRLTP